MERLRNKPSVLDMTPEDFEDRMRDVIPALYADGVTVRTSASSPPTHAGSNRTFADLRQLY